MRIEERLERAQRRHDEPIVKLPGYQTSVDLRNQIALGEKVARAVLETGLDVRMTQAVLTIHLMVRKPPGWIDTSKEKPTGVAVPLIMPLIMPIADPQKENAFVQNVLGQIPYLKPAPSEGDDNVRKGKKPAKGGNVQKG